MSDLFSKTNSIRCHLKHHADLGLGISILCLDEKCLSNKKAICAICAKESHVNHKTISISKIDNCIKDYEERWVQNKLKQQLVNDFHSFTEEIAQCYEQYGNQFSSVLEEIDIVHKLYTSYIQNETINESDLQAFSIELMNQCKLEAGSLSLKFSGQKQIGQLKQLVLEMQSLTLILNKALKQEGLLQSLISGLPESNQHKQYLEQLDKIQDQFILHNSKDIQEDSFILSDKNMINLKCEYFNSVTAIDVSNDASLLAAASNWSNKIIIYDLDSLIVLKILTFSCDRLQAIKFSPNKRWLAVGSAKTGDIMLWDVNNFDQKPLLYQGHKDSINRFSYSNDSKQFCSVSGDRTAYVWECGNTQSSFYNLQGHISAVNGCSFGSQDNIATISDDKNVIIWKSGQIQRKFQAHKDEGYSVDYSNDYEWLLTSGKDKLIKLWSTHNYILLKQFEGHQRGIWTTQFSPYSQYIASASWDDTIRIQNVNNENDVIIVNNQFVNLPQVCITGFQKCIVSSSKTTINIWRR